MERYPNPLRETRDTWWRLGAHGGLAIGGAGLLGFASAGSQPIGWWIAGVLSGIAVAVILFDEARLSHLARKEWKAAQWELLKQNEYRRREGIFLIHTVEPDPVRVDKDGTHWRFTLRIVQHRTGPLHTGEIKYVEYAFGPNFTEGTKIVVHSPVDDFSYTTEAFGPLMMLARVIFKNPFKRPLFVERYVDLPEAP